MKKLIDFWAPWCGPCKLMDPILDELEKEFAGKVEIEKINVDENEEYSQRLGVMSIPTYVLMDGDKEVARRIGFTQKAEMVKLMSS